jgi:Protein of unknown function (DUF2911)
MKKLNLIIVILVCLICSGAVFAQIALPRESQRATVAQTIGDTNVTIVYYRPSVKNRKIWGELVPYGEVWRTGANDNTTFEISANVKINGQDLPAGKYGLHTIPNKDSWIIIFNKVNNEWGSFKYDQKQDALRVTVKPETSNAMREAMMFEFETVNKTTTNVVLTWEKLRVPFTVDAGNVNERVMAKIRAGLADTTAKNYRQNLLTGANFVYNEKMKASYPEALDWTDKALKIQEGFGALRLKAMLLAGGKSSRSRKNEQSAGKSRNGQRIGKRLGKMEGKKVATLANNYR